jgi:lipoate-protein ligase B
VRLWPTGRDVHRYIRAIEAVIIAACASLGVEAMTKPSLTGVWVGTQKLASIGIGVRRGIAFHGLALNVSTDLAYFRAIVPCRMTALTMCNLSDLIVPPPRTEDVASALVAAFENVMGYTSVVVAS